MALIEINKIVDINNVEIVICYFVLQLNILNKFNIYVYDTNAKMLICENNEKNVCFKCHCLIKHLILHNLY